MKLGVDLDGVVCDFQTPANEWLAAKAGVPVLPVDCWDWFKAYPNGGVLWDQLWNHAADKDLFISLKAFPAAHLVLNHLWGVGHDITFITFRPQWAREQTEEWLHRNGFGGFPLVFTANKGEVPWDLLLEDNGPCVAELVQQGRNAVLFRRPWNTEFWNRVPDIDSWWAFKNLVKYSLAEPVRVQA